MIGVQCSKCKDVKDVDIRAVDEDCKALDWEEVVIELNKIGWSAIALLAICPECKK